MSYSNRVFIDMTSKLEHTIKLNIPIRVRRATGEYHSGEKLSSPEKILKNNGWAL